MKKNNFIISAVLGSTLLSTSALGAGIFLGPGTVISAPNIVLDAPVVDIDPSVQINSDNLVVNGENYTSSEGYRESQEFTNFQEVSSSQYQLKENDHKSLEQYAVDLVNATPDLKALSDEFETTKNNSNLSEQ